MTTFECMLTIGRKLALYSDIEEVCIGTELMEEKDDKKNTWCFGRYTFWGIIFPGGYYFEK